MNVDYGAAGEEVQMVFRDRLAALKRSEAAASHVKAPKKPRRRTTGSSSSPSNEKADEELDRAFAEYRARKLATVRTGTKSSARVDKKSIEDEFNTPAQPVEQAPAQSHKEQPKHRSAAARARRMSEGAAKAYAQLDPSNSSTGQEARHTATMPKSLQEVEYEMGGKLAEEEEATLYHATIHGKPHVLCESKDAQKSGFVNAARKLCWVEGAVFPPAFLTSDFHYAEECVEGEPLQSWYEAHGASVQPNWYFEMVYGVKMALDSLHHSLVLHGRIKLDACTVKPDGRLLIWGACPSLGNSEQVAEENKQWLLLAYYLLAGELPALEAPGAYQPLVGREALQAYPENYLRYLDAALMDTPTYWEAFSSVFLEYAAPEKAKSRRRAEAVLLHRQAKQKRSQMKLNAIFGVMIVALLCGIIFLVAGVSRGKQQQTKEPDGYAQSSRQTKSTGQLTSLQLADGKPHLNLAASNLSGEPGAQAAQGEEGKETSEEVKTPAPSGPLKLGDFGSSGSVFDSNSDSLFGGGVGGSFLK